MSIRKKLLAIKQCVHHVGSRLLAAYGRRVLRSHHALEFERQLDGGDASEEYLHADRVWRLSRRIKNHLSNYNIPLKKSDAELAHVMMDIAQCAGNMLSLGALTVSTDNVTQIVASDDLKGTKHMRRAWNFIRRQLDNGDIVGGFEGLQKVVGVVQCCNTPTYDDLLGMIDPLAKNCLKFGAKGLALYSQVTSSDSLKSRGWLSHADQVALSSAAADSLLKQTPAEMWKDALSTAFDIAPPRTEMKNELALKFVEDGRYIQERLSEALEKEQIALFHELREVARESCASSRGELVDQMSALVDEMPKGPKLTRALWCAYDFDPAVVANMSYKKLRRYGLPTHPRMRKIRISEENKV